jgi:hypothetical protein
MSVHGQHITRMPRFKTLLKTLPQLSLPLQHLICASSITTLSSHPLISLDIPSLTDIQPIQELSNILIPHSARLLDIRRTLRHVLNAITAQLDLIFHTF